jgi:hypothetical protein
MTEHEMARVLDEAFAAPLSGEELEELRQRLRMQEEQAAQLRGLPLEDEEPDWVALPEAAP